MPRKSSRLKKSKLSDGKESNSAPAPPPQKSKAAPPPKKTKAAQPPKKTKAAKKVPKTTKSSVSTKPTRTSKKNVGSKKAPVQCTTSEHELEDTMYIQLMEGVDGNLDEDDDHIPPSGVSSEAAHVGVFPVAASANPSPIDYPCEFCKSVLKTKHGFTKHVMAHRIKGCNSKRPSATIIEPLMESFIVKILNDIVSENGNEKKEFVKEVLKVSESGGSEWKDFVSNISNPVLQGVSKPTKILPANQYEEQLISLNKLLNNEEKFSSFLNQLMSLNTASSNQSLGKMILFRLLSKLVDKTVNFVFSEMTVSRQSGQQDNNLNQLDITSDTQESLAFTIHMRKLIQKYYLKGLQHGSKIWLARCACIRQRFVEGLAVDSSPTVDDVISNDAWEEDENGIVKLTLDPKILIFFVRLENIIESLIVNGKTVNSDSVLSILLSSDKADMLEIWHALTSPYLSELESLIFMKDIVNVLCNLSLRLEVGRDRNLTSMARVQKYALRTDLKRN